MLTIITKTLSPTNTKGARIKATIHSCVFPSGRKSVTVPWNHALSHIKCHNEAAQAALDLHNAAMRAIAIFSPSGQDYPPLTTKDLSLGMTDNSDCLYVLTSNTAEI